MKNSYDKDGFGLFATIIGLLACGSFLGYRAVKSRNTAAMGCLIFVIGVFAYGVIIYAAAETYEPLTWIVTIIPWMILSYFLMRYEFTTYHKYGKAAINRRQYYEQIDSMTDPSEDEIHAYRRLVYEKRGTYIDHEVAIYKLKFWQIYLEKNSYTEVLQEIQNLDVEMRKML